MRAGLHPKLMDTTVKCNGCGTTFTTRSTVPSITVEICSNCHPFYTGKQKLVDTAGRVEKFKARTEEAKKRQASRQKKNDQSPAEDKAISTISKELESETVDLEKPVNQKTDS